MALSDECYLKFIAQVFIKSTSFTRQDKIIALELTGAFFITCNRNEFCFDFIDVGMYVVVGGKFIAI